MEAQCLEGVVEVLLCGECGKLNLPILNGALPPLHRNVPFIWAALPVCGGKLEVCSCCETSKIKNLAHFNIIW